MPRFTWFALVLLALTMAVSLSASAQKRPRKPRPAHKVDACQILPAKKVRAVVATLPPDVVGQPSKYSPHPLCIYRWPVPDQKERMAKWQKGMLADGQAGKGMPPRPRLDHEVSLTWLKTNKTEADAQDAFNGAIKTLNKGIAGKTRGNKVDVEGKNGKAPPESGDPTAEKRADALKARMEKQLAEAHQRRPRDKEVEVSIQAGFVLVEGVGDQAAYDEKTRSLMVRDGKQRFTLLVRLDGEAAADLEAAKALARLLLTK